MSDAKARRAVLRELDKTLGVDHPATALKGLLLGAVIIAVMAGLAYGLAMPAGPTTYVHGRVEGLGLRETETGSYPIARVRVGSDVGLVPIPRTANCSAGDRISLSARRTLFGARRYTMSFGGCVG